MAATAAQRLGLAPTFTPLESTSFHVDGRYHSDAEPEEHGLHITRGSSRDQRPDRNQVMLELLVAHHAGIPVLMPPLSGHRRDAHDCGQGITAQIAQWQITSGMTFLVAASALSSAETLHKLAETNLQWIPRVPATLRAAQTILAPAEPQTRAPLTEGSRYRVGPSSYGGLEPRWGRIHSEPRQPPAQRPVDKQWRTQRAQEVNAFRTLCRTAFACAAAAQQALARFAAGLQTTVLHASAVGPTPP